MGKIYILASRDKYVWGGKVNSPSVGFGIGVWKNFNIGLILNNAIDKALIFPMDVYSI